MRDAFLGVDSHWTAKNLYCVAYDPETLIVDEEAAKTLRDGARKARLARGKQYDDFVAEWRKLSPPPELLVGYGTWPDAQPQGYGGMFM